MSVPQLGGSLDFSKLNSNGDLFAGIGQNPATAAAQLGPAYKAGYGGYLDLLEQQHNGIIAGYGNLAQSQDQTQQGIASGFPALNQQVQGYLSPMDQGLSGLHSGYAGLQGSAGGGQVHGSRPDAPYQSLPGSGYAGLQAGVQNMYAGTNQSNINQINNRYNVEQGQAMQNAISNGLGGSTVAMGLQAGVDQRRNQDITQSQNSFAQLQAGAMQNIGLSGLSAQERGINAITGQQNQIASTRAGYANNLGLAGLNYQGQASQNNTNLGLQQLGFQNSVNVTPPDASQYNSLAQQFGGAIQSQQDRAVANQQYQQIAAQGRQQPAGVGGGTTLGSGTPLPGPQGNYGSQANYAGLGGSMTAPDGTPLQVQRPTATSAPGYGLGSYGIGSAAGGATLGGLGAASAGAAGNPGNLGAVGAGAIGSGVSSYLGGLGQDQTSEFPTGYPVSPAPGGGYFGGGGQPQPLGTAPYGTPDYNLNYEDLPYGMAPELAAQLVESGG